MGSILEKIDKKVLEIDISDKLNNLYQGAVVGVLKGEITLNPRGKYVVQSVQFFFYEENVLAHGKQNFQPISSYFIQFTLLDKKHNEKTVRIKNINHLPEINQAP